MGCPYIWPVQTDTAFHSSKGGGRYGNAHIFKSHADIQKGNPAREMGPFANIGYKGLEKLLRERKFSLQNICFKKRDCVIQLHSVKNQVKNKDLNWEAPYYKINI